MVTGWNDKSDEQLLEAIQAGSHHAFSLLVKRHSTRFYAIAYRYMAQREAAEDIVQASFLKLWENPHLWQSGLNAKFTTWFYRIVVNACLDAKKKKKPLPLAEGYEAEDMNAIAADEAIEQQEANIAAANLEVRSLELPAPRREGRIVGKGPDAVEELVRLLREEAKVL